jgi:polyphenol oxidase
MEQPLHQSAFVAPEIFASVPNLVAAQSTRHGGTSPAPFESLNLGLSSGDLEKNVVANREIFFGEQGVALNQIALSHQVHGDQIFHAQQAGRTEGYDALITNQKNLFLAVSVADCVPILIYDQAHRAVAAVHAGWRGTSKQILFKTLQQMRGTFGTTAHDCLAYIGACISAESYEVDADVARHFNDDVKSLDIKRDNTDAQKFHLDLKRANAMQLRAFGLSDSQIETSPFCTYRDSSHFFSHRLATHKTDGKTGRMMAMIGLR